MRITACKMSSDVQMLNTIRNQRKDINEFVKQVVSSFNIKLTESKSLNCYLIAHTSAIKL
jgi:hypothetical protein